MNHPLTLEIPENIYESLVKKAKQAVKSPEVMAAQLLTSATQTLIDDPLEPFIGAFGSHGSDWADPHDKYLRLSVNQKMQRIEII